MFKSKVIFLGAVSLLVAGCASSGGLVINHLNTEYLPAVQKDAAQDKKTLEFGRKCLSRAKTAEEANQCNTKVRQMDSQIDIDDFSRWNGSEKARVLALIDEKLVETNCILNAKDIEEALDKCE